MKTEIAARQLNYLIEKYAVYQASSSHNTKQTTALTEGAHAAIDRLTLGTSTYRSACDLLMDDEDMNENVRLDRLFGIIEALRDDYMMGAIDPIQDLIRAEVFGDFLDMADHLLDAGYKDPAAVLIGGVIEQHLRKLCARDGIPVESDGKPKKADLLNAELSKAGSYGILDQKNIVSWLDLRNRAAHAQYDAYNLDQVRIMFLGVRDFISRSIKA